MDYVNIYNQLIEYAKNRDIDDGVIRYENHHIVPRSLGGSDDESNLVKLTLREHYVAHKLLLYVYPRNNKIIYSFWMMTSMCVKDNNNRIVDRVIVSSRDYETAKNMLLQIKIGSKYNDEQRKHVSDATKKAMRTRNNINKSISGSLGCRHYYDIKTNKAYKWFYGDPPIDETKYRYGRPPLKETFRLRLSDLKNIDRTYYYIKELDIRYTCYNDYVKSVPDNWQIGWSNNKSKHIRNAIIKAVREFNLRTNYEYDDLIIRNYCGRSKSFKVITPAIYELFYDILSKSKYEDVSNELCEAILINIDKIKELNKKYFV